jgi:hypothetical protein
MLMTEVQKVKKVSASLFAKYTQKSKKCFS